MERMRCFMGLSPLFILRIYYTLNFKKSQNLFVLFFCILKFMNILYLKFFILSNFLGNEKFKSGEIIGETPQTPII